LRKLDGTDDDLERVEDLLYEIEKNLKSLEKQARQAEQYLTLKEKYKNLSIVLSRLSAKQKIELLNNLKKQTQEEQDKKTLLGKEIAQGEALLEKTKAELVGAEKDLRSFQKALNDHVEQIRNYESDKQVKSERLKNLNNISDNLKSQLEEDKKDLDRTKFSLKVLENERDEAEKIESEIEKSVDTLQKAYASQKEKTAKIQSQLLEANNGLKKHQEEVYHLNKSLEIKEIQLSALKEEMEKTHTEASEKSASLEEFETKLGGLSGTLEQKNKKLKELKSGESDLQSKIESLTNTIEVVKEELNHSLRDLDVKQNEYNLTKSMVENLEGFPEAIKFLRKNSAWGKTAPLLSDIISCSEDYRVTVENYLEPYMNYYVVDTEAQAFEAVNLLSDASKGKANFFILDSFKDFKPSATQLFENAIPATEIIEFEGKYRKLVSHILDKVYIVNGDLADVPRQEDFVFITKNGKVTISRHSVMGGSVGLFEGKRIGRAKNLEKLDKQIKNLDKKIDQINQNLETKQLELVRLKESTKKFLIDQLQEEINQDNGAFISLKTKKEQFSQMISSHSTKKEDMMESAADLEKEIKDLKPKVDAKSGDYKVLDANVNQLTAEFQVQNTSLIEASNSLNQENIKFHQQENKTNRLRQEISFKESNSQSIQSKIDSNQRTLENTLQEINKLVKNTESSDDELISMYAEKGEKEKEVNQSEKEYYSIRGQIDHIEKDIREVQRSKESVDTILMELQNKLNDAKLDLSSVKERLSVEFNLDLEDIMIQHEDEKTSEMTEEELAEKVFKMKERIERMGPVNPMAMEAYDEIKERFEFITTQRVDLIEAKESLLSTIQEIDSAARETFLEAFEKIKESFIKVFRTLFTEKDDCDLKISDPNNPLESTIEIIAKPKGKKPQTINQLSGGEKTLTAISVLFAIYLLKPAPFCIFDEVDAPLDDANIDKFNSIIRDFSQDSQFIIVTHNKRTMSSIDIIYGITMVEQGISRVVPVDIRELA